MLGMPKISSSDKHVQKNFTHWLAHMKIIWAHHMHFHYSQPGRVWLVTSQLGTGKSLTFSSLPPVTHILCPRLSFLSNVMCLLSHIFKMCLSSYVPRLTALFIVSRPLSYVAHLYSLSPVCCPQLYISVPCLLSSVPCLMSLFPFSCTLYPLSCDLSPILLYLSPNPYKLSQCSLFCSSNVLVHCSSVSRPLFFNSCSLSLVFQTCKNAGFS